ncbi:MAG: hypothetical protein J7480_06440 [Microbacteriaceae bacterium]|nr:hypothetical protein [Microbacteriaceae bacterium]
MLIPGALFCIRCGVRVAEADDASRPQRWQPAPAQRPAAGEPESLAMPAPSGPPVPPAPGPELDEDQTLTVERPTLLQADGPLLPPPRGDQVPGGRPPIARRADDNETQEVQVDALALVSTWYLLLPDGLRVDVMLPLVLGRKPSREAAPDYAQLVTVPDQEGTVSRNHALIEAVGGVLKLTNISKKNTIPVAWPDGVRYNILPGEHLVIASMCAAKLGNVPVLLQRA